MSRIFAATRKGLFIFRAHDDPHDERRIIGDNAASIDQSSVTQLIGRGSASRWCENRAGSTRSRSIPKRSRFHARPRSEKPRGDFVRSRGLPIDRPVRRRARALTFLAVAKQPLRKRKRRASPLV